jgi:hypothetical protein
MSLGPALQTPKPRTKFQEQRRLGIWFLEFGSWNMVIPICRLFFFLGKTLGDLQFEQIWIESFVPSELLEDHERLVAWPSASRSLTIDTDSHGQICLDCSVKPAIWIPA